MPKLPRLNAKEAEELLLKAGFMLNRTKGSHKIYRNDNKRFILPFHSGKILHPKIIKQLYKVIENSSK